MSPTSIKRATVMTLLNIGELAHHLSKEFKASTSQIPFNEIVALRNNAAHGYLTLNFKLVWQTIKTDIPDLQNKIKQLIS